MSSFGLILLLLGPLVIFAVVKSGLRLIIPLSLCVLASLAGMILFVWASHDPIAPNDPEFAINPVSVAAAVVAAVGFYGVLLLAVVFVARTVSGEYRQVRGSDEQERPLGP